MKVFMVFGGSLAFDERKNVVLGQDTKMACDLAVKLCSTAGNGSLIVATAGIPPDPKWRKIWMAYAMIDYMKTINVRLLYRHQNAETFSTFGEARALAKVLPSLLPRHHVSAIDEVVIVTKDWHAPRAKMNCQYWFSREGLTNHICTETFEYPASYWTRTIRENLATWNDRRKRLG